MPVHPIQSLSVPIHVEVTTGIDRRDVATERANAGTPSGQTERDSPMTRGNANARVFAYRGGRFGRGHEVGTGRAKKLRLGPTWGPLGGAGRGPDRRVLGGARGAAGAAANWQGQVSGRANAAADTEKLKS